MSSRQARRERREAERKAKKAEFQRLKAEGLLAASAIASSVPVSSDPNEYPPEVIADAYAIRDRIYAQLVNGPDRPSIVPSPTTQASFGTGRMSQTPSPLNRLALFRNPPPNALKSIAPTPCTPRDLARKPENWLRLVIRSSTASLRAR